MPDEIAERVDRLELPFDARGVDDYGVSKWHLTVVFRALAALYRYGASRNQPPLCSTPRW